jgi:hypothetical protein
MSSSVENPEPGLFHRKTAMPTYRLPLGIISNQLCLPLGREIRKVLESHGLHHGDKVDLDVAWRGLHLRLVEEPPEIWRRIAIQAYDLAKVTARLETLEAEIRETAGEEPAVAFEADALAALQCAVMDHLDPALESLVLLVAPPDLRGELTKLQSAFRSQSLRSILRSTLERGPSSPR